MFQTKKSLTALVLGATICFHIEVHAKQVALDVSLANPIMAANQKQTTFLKVGLTGFKLPSAEERVPVNIALVIDKSGSMSGQKIIKAKEAAIAAIDRLRADDIVSVVVYDQGVRVVVPATKLTDKGLVNFQHLTKLQRLSLRATAIYTHVRVQHIGRTRSPLDLLGTPAARVLG